MTGSTRRVIVLGCTGSIGVQTLEVIAHLNTLHARGGFPLRHEVVGLAAGRNAARLEEQRRRFPGARAVLAGPDPGSAGPDAAACLVRDVQCDLVVAAISGAAGLPAAWEAVGLGRDLALANKETLVAAGGLIIPAARRTGTRILPVDSEHAALWQCLAAASGSDADGAPPLDLGATVERVWITASGGALRGRSPEDLHHATPDEALKHPTWNMGPKVTIDSATLMNKALEVIEAHWLFGIPADRIGVLIHPQSIVHAIAECVDGGALAHLAAADMRHPIQHALAWPHRASASSRRLDWSALATLELRPVSGPAARAVELGLRAIRQGGVAGAALEGANEAAVRAFLEKRLPFGRIVELAGAGLERFGSGPLRSIEDALAAAAEARRFVERSIG